MKTALIAAAAAALTVTISSGAAFADTVGTVWKPFGPTQTPKKVRVHRHYEHRDYRPTYRPVYRPSPVQISAAELAEKRREAFADGRISFIEKIKLNAAQRRHEALVRSYR
ncbi:MAG TPA: hypothetical protein VNZ50_17140 [Hyphomicrobiaceae bacterium]|nr:hypothetical protein [Hyphomicrobiaceae bacterium]